MSVPPPGSLIDEAAKFAEALLGKVRGADLPPELAARFTAAVTDVAVAGAGLLRVVADVAAAWGQQPPEDGPDEPRVERIDVG